MEAPLIEPKIEASWRKALEEEFGKPYIKELKLKLVEEYRSGNAIYPAGNQIFNAFNLTPFNKVKVVILGQDPYHGRGQAHGLSFSVPSGVTPPPSLVNIFRELHEDVNIPLPTTGNLEPWASRGVLLLNAILTVRANRAASHRALGWEQFTDAVIKTISDKRAGVVFMLWGNFAKEKEALIDTSKHLVLKAAHPSPFSAYSGFFGCKHFSKANKYIVEHGETPIDWAL